jgi:signal recognition particle subunit SRP54
MTREERRTPKIINGSRRARIAAGSGVSVGEVSQLIVRFLEGQKMMRQMMGAMPGMGGMRRGGGKARGKGKKKGGGRPASAPSAQQPAQQPAQPGLPAPGQFPAGLGRGGPAGLPAGFGGLGGGDGDLKLPSGFPPPGRGPALPPGLRGPQGPQPGRRGKKPR